MKPISRKKFLKITSLASFALYPTVKALADIFGTNEEILNGQFQDEFHYFDNNLTNLHFYFINAKIKNRKLRVSEDLDAFMVVKIPQQHISEQLLREETFKDEANGYINDKKNTDSKISGFSYLAFRILPNVKKRAKAYIPVDDVADLLDWSNNNYFDLVIPDAVDYVSFPDDSHTATPDGFSNFRKNSKFAIAEDIHKDALAFYKTVCTTLFNKNDNNFPVTLLEIPRGLFITPYAGKQNSKEKKPVKATFSNNRIEKQQFIYNAKEGKVVRSVEEIWNAQMWFQQFTDGGNETMTPDGVAFDPSFRPVGYTLDEDEARSKTECPKEDVSFLPTLLDKQELTYIASLGREGAGNEGFEWNINAKGLVFTGLGVIGKFHYKNFSPPIGTDLAEYEHHIALGRDEYIKVARIGVISVTGQRALHVKIGQRKIKNGISYMEFKEYIEIIQKELPYFDSKLFIKTKPGTQSEPVNYIQARIYPVKANLSGIIHSIDPAMSDGTTVWRDEIIWKIQKYLPAHWHTSYRRWPFWKVVCPQPVSKPINSNAPRAQKITSPDCDCAEVFWPVLEADISKDCTLDFIGYDWNNNAIAFSATFLFIRKMAIECNNANLYDTLYKNFTDAVNSDRRIINFNKAKIAFTQDYIPADGQTQLPNKSNAAKTDFVEYYFSLCKESDGHIVEDDIATPPVKADSVFNERFFPLYPQIRRTQLYDDNIQAATYTPTASIIEIHDDFINYGFYDTVKDKAGVPLTAIRDGKPVNIIYNKARLIFKHTDAFVANTTDKILQFTDGRWVENKSAEGYAAIKKAFGNAGDKIGGLVNPDFDVQAIGLIKQSISVGKDINKKYEQAVGVIDKIKEFNPTDLLRQAPEIFNGISLLDILKEVFPDYEAPVNEIKNVASQIENLENTLVNNVVSGDIQKKIAEAREKVGDLKKQFEQAQGVIKEAEKNIGLLKDRLNKEFQFGDVENLVNNKIETYRLYFVSEYDKVRNRVEMDAAKATNYIVSEIISRLEIINQAVETVSMVEATIAKIKDHITNAQEIAAGKKTELLAYLNDYLVNVPLKTDLDNFFKLVYDGGNYLGYSEIVKKIDAVVPKAINAYTSFKNKLAAEADAKSKLLNKLIDNATYNKALKEYNDAKDAYDKIADASGKVLSVYKDSKERAKQLYNNLVARASKELIDMFAADILLIQSKTLNAYELILTGNLSYLVEGYEESERNYEICKSKIGALKDEVTRESKIRIQDVESELQKVKNLVQSKRQELIDAYTNVATGYDSCAKGIKDKLNNAAIIFVNQTVQGKKQELENYLRSEYYPRIGKVKELFGEAIKDANGKIEYTKDTIRYYQNEIDKNIQLFTSKRKEYEDALNKFVHDSAAGIVAQVKDIITGYEQQILNDPDNAELINKLVKARELYNILTSLKQKEVNFNWQTSSFKDADFGIVSFVSSNNPKTSLSVNVRNTIHFKPNQFPPVVQRIESFAENKLNNFGISLMKAMTVNFNEVSFSVGTGQSPKFNVKIRDVQFAGAFSFVQAFESYLKSLMGDAFRLKLQPTNVNIGYTLPIPEIRTPGFNFFNLTLNFDFWLHFDKKPMQLGFSLGRIDNKFGMSVGIYAGFGFFSIIAEPKRGLTQIEIGMEFGGYFGLSLGPLRGEVKLVVGLYYRKDDDGVIMEGYFLCEGRVQLWFIMINARFYMGVRSQNNYVEGRCTVTYEIRLGRFFKKSFEATYYKKIAGANPGNRQAAASNKERSINRLIEAAEKQKTLLLAIQGDAAGHNIVSADTNLLAPLAAESTTVLNATYDKINHPDTDKYELLKSSAQRAVRALNVDEWDDFINSYN